LGRDFPWVQVAESMSAAGEALADAEEGSVVFDI